tara:strand:- start:305 stop:583 length:279 start_codon:yes stop_codon:yes gene_type:complete
MYLEIGIIALQTVVICSLMILLHRGISRGIHTGLKQLDYQIAEAINKIVTGSIDLPEPPNPFQQLIFEYFKNNMTPKAPNVELIRGDDGKFT